MNASVHDRAPVQAVNGANYSEFDWRYTGGGVSLLEAVEASGLRPSEDGRACDIRGRTRDVFFRLKTQGGVETVKAVSYTWFGKVRRLVSWIFCGRQNIALKKRLAESLKKQYPVSGEAFEKALKGTGISLSSRSALTLKQFKGVKSSVAAEFHRQIHEQARQLERAGQREPANKSGPPPVPPRRGMQASPPPPPPPPPLPGKLAAASGGLKTRGPNSADAPCAPQPETGTGMGATNPTPVLPPRQMGAPGANTIARVTGCQQNNIITSVLPAESRRSPKKEGSSKVAQQAGADNRKSESLKDALWQKLGKINKDIYGSGSEANSDTDSEWSSDGDFD